jgi:hypothetical protein
MPKFLQDLIQKPDFINSERYSLKQKKIISKILYSFGWGSPTIARWLNISRGTVLKANKQPTPSNLSSFEFGFKQEVLKMNYQAIYQVNKKILDLVPLETDISKLVDVGQYFSQI